LAKEESFICFRSLAKKAAKAAERKKTEATVQCFVLSAIDHVMSKEDEHDFNCDASTKWTGGGKRPDAVWGNRDSEIEEFAGTLPQCVVEMKRESQDKSDKPTLVVTMARSLAVRVLNNRAAYSFGIYIAGDIVFIYLLTLKSVSPNQSLTPTLLNKFSISIPDRVVELYHALQAIRSFCDWMDSTDRERPQLASDASSQLFASWLVGAISESPSVSTDMLSFLKRKKPEESFEEQDVVTREGNYAHTFLSPTTAYKVFKASRQEYAHHELAIVRCLPQGLPHVMSYGVVSGLPLVLSSPRCGTSLDHWQPRSTSEVILCFIHVLQE